MLLRSFSIVGAVSLVPDALLLLLLSIFCWLGVGVFLFLFLALFCLHLLHTNIPSSSTEVRQQFLDAYFHPRAALQVTGGMMESSESLRCTLFSSVLMT